MIIFESLTLFLAQIIDKSADIAKARLAAARIVQLLNRVPAIDNWRKEDTSTDKTELFRDSIRFDSVDFSYPARPNVKILRQFSATIKKGQQVALVGASGCGKQQLHAFLASNSLGLSFSVQKANRRLSACWSDSTIRSLATSSWTMSI